MSDRTKLWFDEMNLLGSEKQERISACKDLQDRLEKCFSWLKSNKCKYVEYENRLLMNLLAWMIIVRMITDSDFSKLETLYSAYGISKADILENAGKKTDDLPNSDIGNSISAELYNQFSDIEQLVKDIVAGNKENEDDENYLSSDRAFYIARDFTNKTFNDRKHLAAIKAGKKYHKWVSMIDKRTRKTHIAMNSVVVPISQPFNVNGSLMRYPMDSSLGASPEEIYGCRCTEETF